MPASSSFKTGLDNPSAKFKATVGTFSFQLYLGKNTGIPPGVSGHTCTRTRTNTRTRMVGVGNHTGMSHSTLGYTHTWVYPRVLHFYWSSVGICSKCVCSMFTMCS